MWLRWELSKVWKCKVDDPIFDDITLPQWYFYSAMISKDKKIEMDNNIALVEYLASFWNADAVRKIQDMRNSAKDHSFQNDKEFEESLISGEYKQNPILDAVLKMRESEKNKSENLSAPRTKLPTDLSIIYNTLNKFNKN